MKLKILLILILINFSNLHAEEKKIDSNDIFKNIRCLICQGQSVADSNSDFAQTIKLVVNDKINKGKTEAEIYDFLITKYGEWIVYKPPFNFSNSFLWILPYLAFLFGGFLIFLVFKKRNNN